jgi:hypothetical protein
MMPWDRANIYSPIHYHQLGHAANCNSRKSYLVYGVSLNPRYSDVYRKGWAWPHSFTTLFASCLLVFPPYKCIYALQSGSVIFRQSEFIFTLIQVKSVTSELKPASLSLIGNLLHSVLYYIFLECNDPLISGICRHENSSVFKLHLWIVIKTFNVTLIAGNKHIRFEHYYRLLFLIRELKMSLVETY